MWRGSTGVVLAMRVSRFGVGSSVVRLYRMARRGGKCRSHHEFLAEDRGRLLALGVNVDERCRTWDVELGDPRRRP
jgi:hypothetical protein